ncbi:MAG: DUF2087 domain-containing protein [Rhodobacteraceae bacterium]|nr:DUF2087 domain-containing protein [Paracoccaceae bacterium]MCF8513342.1 DUF2087 domain-containing protein [Paracoccaceae bacterium]MCF8517758.1 DUF2087 domain-containing protein [Paracoccaceae bacterium]
MTKDALSLPVPDLSAFAKTLRRELTAAHEIPGHLALMNMAARAAGFRNVQHLRSSATAQVRLDSPAAPAPDHAKIEATLRHFDGQGRLATWPARTALQHLAVRALWARLPPRITLTERQFSAVLTQWHGFGDPPILRRTMVELGLVTRSADCRDYQRVEAQPTPEARLLIGLLADRTRT